MIEVWLVLLSTRIYTFIYEIISKHLWGLCTSRHDRNESLPPQQNPAAPIAETPFSFNAAIIGFASSNPLSYMK